MTTTSAGTRLGIRKLTARIGAEVTGLGPGLELDPDAVAAVRAALNEHKALVFRGIDLDDDGQQRFARYFGPLTTAHPTVPAVAGRAQRAAGRQRGRPGQSLAHRRDLRAQPAAGQHAAQHRHPPVRRRDPDRQRRRGLPGSPRAAAGFR